MRVETERMYLYIKRVCKDTIVMKSLILLC